MGDFHLFGIPISLGTMIYQAIIFTILVIVLKKFVLKKLVNVMENRKRYIERQLQLAEKYRLDAEKALETQDNLLRQARKDVKEIINHGEIQARLIIKDAKQEAKSIIKEAKEEALTIRSQPFNQNRHNKGA